MNESPPTKPEAAQPTTDKPRPLVNLELRPEESQVSVGDTFNVDLVAVAQGDAMVPIQSGIVIVRWKPALLEFLKHDAADAQPLLWEASNIVNAGDDRHEHLRNVNLSDGNAVYGFRVGDDAVPDDAASYYPAQDDPAHDDAVPDDAVPIEATPVDADRAGLVLTTFQFKALCVRSAVKIEICPVLTPQARTFVSDGVCFEVQAQCGHCIIAIAEKPQPKVTESNKQE